VGATVIDCFEKIIKGFPEKTALCCGSGSVSYAELGRKMERVAQKLSQYGIGREDIITIRMERGIDAVCAMLGVLRAGAAFCFISPDYPEERVRFIVDDTRAKYMIDEAWMEELPSLDDTLQCVRPQPDDPAIIVYTSGSTGNPKGVINSHRALMLAVRGNALLRNENDVVLSTASFSFIAVAMDMLAPLVMVWPYI
jgi:surfactin family lipopeptide synthetase A/bacitracin synthase 1